MFSAALKHVMTGKSSLTVSGDPGGPLLASNVLLLKTIGTNNATNASFVDSSSNNFTVTRAGDVTQGAFSPYVPTGYWSAFFDGTGDRITAAHNAAFRLTGDFTVECWVNFVAVAGRSNWLMGCLEYPNETGWMFRYTGTALRFYNADLGAMDRSWTPALGVWYHLAVTRSSGQIRMFIDGVQQGAAVSNSTAFSASTALAAVGGDPNFGSDTNAFISNARVVNGTAVYTSNFTPPTTPLTAISGTSLLTCQDNRFIDRSSNNFTLTQVGDVSVRRFAPFGLSWDGSLGGSAYFDGNADYLSIADNVNLQFGTSDFALEFWWFPTSITGYPTPFEKGYGGAGGILLQTGLNDGKIIVYFSGAATVVSTVSVKVNQWNHIAVTREGNTFRIFQDGVLVGLSSAIISSLNSTSNVSIGARNSDGAYAINGYLSDVRIVKGSAVYTSAFSPPTSPLNAVSGTQLLAKFNNAGVYDATRSSNLSLVGDTKTSTGQVKYATTSVALDGVGDDLRPAINPPPLGTGDFTIEGWWRITNVDLSTTYWRRLLTWKDYYGLTLFVSNSQVVGFGAYDTYPLMASSSPIALNTWYHIAVCRAGSTSRLFINGAQVASAPDSQDYTAATTGTLFIGSMAGSGGTTSGNMEDLRISRTARYTAAFTPPTSALPVTAG